MASELNTLAVTILTARGLLSKDKNGSSDPFMELICENTKVKTSVQKKCLNPTWNEKVT